MKFPEVSKNGCVYGADKMLCKFEKHIEKLKKTDVHTFRRKIEEAPDVETKSKHVRNLLEKNIPASLDLLENLLEKHRNDKLLYLELMSHRQHVAVWMESFTRARRLAEEAHVMAKDLYQSLENGSMVPKLPSKPTYKAYVKSCVNLILVCRYQGKIADAEIYLEEANRVAKDEDDQQLLLILSGDLLLARNQPNDAIETIFIPLLCKPQISRENKGLLLQKLGIAYSATARWGRAKEYLRESIKIAEDLEDLITKFDRATDLGSVYQMEGRIADALDQMIPHMSFALIRGDSWGLTVACYNVCHAYNSVNRKSHLERAFAMACLLSRLLYRRENESFLPRTFGGEPLQVGIQLTMNIRTGSAEQTVRKLACRHIFHGKKSSGYRSEGKYDEVIEEHYKHLLNAMRIGDNYSVAHFQTELAIDYVCKGDFDNAEKEARGAILTLEFSRIKLGGEDASKIANFDKNQSEAYNLLQVILCRQGKHSEALAMSELARSRALTDLIRDKLLKTSDVETESWIHFSHYFVFRWQRLQGDILSDFMKSADKLNTNFLVYSVLKDYDINGSAEPWLYIWLVLNENSANGGDRIRFERQILNEDVVGELEENQYFATLTRSLKFSQKIISGEDQTLRSPPLDTPLAPPMSTKKETHREQVLTRDTVQQSENLQARTKEEEPNDNTADIILERVMECGSWNKEGFIRLIQLYEVCIAPINDYLPETKDGIVPSITIIPHKFLFGVPFCCLHNGNSEYFVERFVLSYVPSLQALLLLNERLKHLKREQGNRNLKVLAMGYAAMFLPGTRDLPCSGDEVKHVQSVFGPELCQLATRSDATKRLLLRELKNIDILHVATHATSQDTEVEGEESQGDYSMRGCLILASSDEDCIGVVYAPEIAAVDSTCQLITLSCCETGLGKLTGDGVLGLYRAFFAAGTASLLVTLWKISDEITPLFMEHFYDDFKATGNVSGSLRSAMLYCIREKNLPPQCWAAFSFIGATSS